MASVITLGLVFFLQFLLCSYWQNAWAQQGIRLLLTIKIQLAYFNQPCSFGLILLIYVIQIKIVYFSGLSLLIILIAQAILIGSLEIILCLINQSPSHNQVSHFIILLIIKIALAILIKYGINREIQQTPIPLQAINIEPEQLQTLILNVYNADVQDSNNRKEELFTKMPFLKNEKIIIVDDNPLLTMDLNFELNPGEINCFLTSQVNNLLYQIRNAKVREHCKSLETIICLPTTAVQGLLKENRINQHQPSLQLQDGNIFTLAVVIQKLFAMAETTELTHQIFTSKYLECSLPGFENSQVNFFLTNLNQRRVMILHFQDFCSTDPPKEDSISSHSSPLIKQDTTQGLLHSCQSLSHEFGTPLNLITTISEEGYNDPNMSTYLKEQFFRPLLINSQLMTLQLANIRDYCALVQDNFFLKIEDCDLKDVITGVKDIYQNALEEKDIKYRLTFKEDDYLELYSDKQRISQVVHSLLSNAIRFTEVHGKIDIQVKPVKGIDPLIQIKVSDNGIGMNPEERIKLQSLLTENMFKKVSANSVGCGLGLTIANQICQEIGSQDQKGISFSSTKDVGSSFWFCIRNVQKRQSLNLSSNQSQNSKSHSSNEIQMISKNSYIELEQFGNRRQSLGPQGVSISVLPSEMHQQKQGQKLKARQSCISLHGLQPIIEEDSMILEDEPTPEKIPVRTPQINKSIVQIPLIQKCCTKVLIVDDEYFNILALTVILRNFDFSMEHAFNGRDALHMVDKKRNNPCQTCGNKGYLIYFLDINMPVMDGYETVRRLKEMMTCKQLQQGICIANTAFSDLETKQKCYQSGMDVYLSKPINRQELTGYLYEKFQLQSQ